MSIESVKIGFENCIETVEPYHISDSKAYHLAQIQNGMNFQSTYEAFNVIGFYRESRTDEYWI